MMSRSVPLLLRRLAAAPAMVLFLVAVPAMILCVGAAPAIAATQVSADSSPESDPRSLSYPPLSISFPKPDRVRLSNGLLVYLLVDDELPLIDLAFYMKAGAIYDPPDKTGLSDIAMLLMRTGGTSDRTPDEVDEALEFMPASVSLSAGFDMASGSLSTLKSHFPEALRILAAMLREPRLDPERLELAKARTIEQIRRRWDNPASIADLNFRMLVYGSANPWARLATAETVGAVGRDDLKAFHRRYVHPNNMVMGIAGDFEPAAMKTLLRETFGSWAHAKVTPPRVHPLKSTASPGVHFIERPLSQANIEIGHLGATRFSPDKFPLKILNFILGEGGFSSRLMKEVRSTRGLAYSVGGGVGIDSDRGLFQISSRTRADATIEAIEVIRGIMDQLRNEGPTEEEVRQAKESSINSFVFSVEGTVQYMRAFLYYEAYNYPRNFLQTYRDKLSKVTRKQVLQAARKHIRPDRLVILAVGNPGTFDRPLASLELGDPREIILDVAESVEGS
jgi:predicted Zn-dependent peptidase